MVIKLYIDYGSQPARAVLSLCLINNIPHEVVEIKLLKGEVGCFSVRTARRNSRRLTR